MSDVIDINFDKAEELFNNYIDTCEVTSEEFVEPSELNISTITITGIIGNLVNDTIINNCLPLSNQIVYVECGSLVRGKKPEKKKKRVKKTNDISKFKKIDKRKRGKGKSFSNQVSLGVYIENHKKPVNVKLFKNGGIHMAGCKSLDEGKYVFNIVANHIKKIPIEHKVENSDKVIKIYPIENMVSIQNSKLKINMINSTFKTNFKIDQLKLYNLLLEKYDTEEIFTTYNCCMSSPVRVYLKNISIYDEKKQKKKQPSLFIYRSGSINVVVPVYDLLEKSYTFINKFLKDNYDHIVQKSLILT